MANSDRHHHAAKVRQLTRMMTPGSGSDHENTYKKVTPDQGQGVKVRNGIRSWRADTTKGPIILGVRHGG